MKIRVMQVLQTMGIGGLENGVVNLVNNMNPESFDFYICCLRGDGPFRSRIKDNVKVININEKPGFNLSTSFKIARLCRDNKIDVVYTHGWACGLFSGTIGGKLAGVPVIINGEHGVIYTETKKRTLAQRTLYKMIDLTVPVSSDLKTELVKRLGVDPKKIQPILNGVDTVKFKPDLVSRADIRKEFGFPVNGQVIGCLCRLTLSKDVATLVKAVGILKNRIKNIKLLIVGSGPEEQNLKDLVLRLHLEDIAIFAGPRVDVDRVINAIDVFALPSTLEGISNTILEAMSTAKPVVVSRIEGNTELVTENVNGIFAKAGDPETFAEKINELLSNKDKAKMLGENGRLYVLQHRSLDIMVKNYENMISNIYKGKSKHV